jgi:excisionase family DNA binding protein
MEPLLLKAGDVAKLLGLGRSKVFAMLAVGELPVVRIGRSVRVPRAALDDWIAEHTQHASGPRGDAGPPFVGVDGVPGARPQPAHARCSPRADVGPSTGVAQSVVQGVVLRSDALFEPGSNVDFYRKCSSIFLISNRPAGVIKRQDQATPSSSEGAGPTVHLDVAGVWPHKARRRVDGRCGPPRPESRHVRPHVGTSAREPRSFSIAMARGRKKDLQFRR